VTSLAESFIDDLSTWWLRRSRRRFWKTEEDQDKTDAYLTLHEALVTLSRLLAPLVPFLCESLYQNLIRRTDTQTSLSVHLTPYPEPVLDRIDAALEREMNLVKEIIGLGRAARNKANLKVRQPLREMILVGLTSEEQAVVHELAEVILEELNIKSLRCEDQLLGLQQILLLPNLPVLGPRFGKKMPAIRNALQETDAEQALTTLASGQLLRLELPEGRIELAASDILIQRHDRPGFAAEASGHCLLALETELDDGLRQEGLARELVHAIQNLRKEAGFQVEDAIRTYYQSDPSLAPIWQGFSAYLQRETLSEALLEGIPAGVSAQELCIEGKSVRLYLERVTE
jgi:isoleucyl-tRNA synthetase